VCQNIADLIWKVSRQLIIGDEMRDGMIALITAHTASVTAAKDARLREALEEAIGNLESAQKDSDYDFDGMGVTGDDRLIPRLKAALATPAAQTVGEVGNSSGFTFAWLIEWPSHDALPAQWWHTQEKWVRDAFKALKFASQYDAEVYIKNHMANVHAIATEHGFDGESPFQRSALAAGGKEGAPSAPTCPNTPGDTQDQPKVSSHA
jgi:hypothetical protein